MLPFVSNLNVSYGLQNTELKTRYNRTRIADDGGSMILVTGATGHIGNVLIRELITHRLWGRMSIVDTKAFMLQPVRHSIFGRNLRVIRITA